VLRTGTYRGVQKEQRDGGVSNGVHVSEEWGAEFRGSWNLDEQVQWFGSKTLQGGSVEPTNVSARRWPKDATAHGSLGERGGEGHCHFDLGTSEERPGTRASQCISMTQKGGLGG